MSFLTKWRDGQSEIQQPIAFFGRRARLRPMAYLLVAAFVLLSVLLSPAQSQTAKAAPGYGYQWTLVFDFESGFDGVLTVDAGVGEVNSLSKILVSRRFNVPCGQVGDVGLGGGNAQFGGGYLKCKLDLASAINTTLASCAQLDPGCIYALPAVEQYGGLKMSARVMATQTGETPIFHHPDASFTVDVGTGVVVLNNEINPVPGIISSPPVPQPLFPPTMQYYAARYLCLPGPLCNMHYSAAGGAFQVGPYFNLVQMQTTPVMFYIGHNPGTGATMPPYTDLDNLIIDPAAIGDH